MFNLGVFLMKKTLIALAVLAASGASFAQVSITGSYAYGYEASSTAATGDKSGLGIDTTYVAFAASEDLGGGMKASALMALDGFGRGTATGGDSNLTLSGGFGSLSLDNGKGSEYLSGDYVGMDEKVFSAKTVSDSVTYKTPSFSGFTVSLSHAESDASGAVGLGVGAAGTYTGQRSNTISLSYAAGPLSVNAGLRSYDQQGDKSLARAKASYDLGVAKIGGGIVQKNLATGTRTDSLIGAIVPFGNLTLVADIANRKLSDTGADSTVSGYGLSASYALSKRTGVSLTYANWDVAGAATRSTKTSLLLAHSF
jgi:hypothetical protein